MDNSPVPASQRVDSALSASPGEGVLLGVGSTLIWGMFPLVFKQVAHIPALEVLAHRSAWSLVFVIVLMVLVGRGRELSSKSFYQPKTLRIMALSGAAVACNWGIFIWAVANDVVLQSSLGYYISPLMSVVLGVVILRERLRTTAWAAVGLAGFGVGFLVMSLGLFPWVSFGLAVSWAIYGLVRKTAPVGSLPGLYLETLLLLPWAMAYIVWLSAFSGTAVFFNSLTDAALLIVTGFVTALPLLLFARAARILRLSSLGLLMYIVPTGQFVLAVFVFDEPFTLEHLIAFACIWLALGIYGWGSSREVRP
ncbi:EamA family transporter RarD [Magnetovibrio sp. PR-2]|uniref:EamA family transporter RarD n=1 Tax=Magnetovibrio sp. PR-2 TaxID=3120356 RepID=UPI002FCE419F